MGVEAAIIGSSLISAGAGLYGSSQAAGAQSSASAAAAANQMAMFNAAKRMLKPYRRSGREATESLENMLGLRDTGAGGFGSETGKFTYGDYTQDPGYAFRLSEGMKALEAGAAARGGLLSGNTLRASQDYAQNVASNEYTNAFNRFYAEREARLNPLFRLSGQGLNAATSLAGAATGMGSAMAQNAYNQGNIAASGYGGMAGAIGSIGNAIGQIPAYQEQSALNAALRDYYTGTTAAPGYNMLASGRLARF